MRTKKKGVEVYHPFPDDAKAILDLVKQKDLKSFFPELCERKPERVASKLLESRKKTSANAYYGIWKQKKLLGLVRISRIDMLNSQLHRFKMTVAVAKQHRKNGLATEAVLCIRKSFKESVRPPKITAESPSRKHVATSLFERCGFEQTEIHPGYITLELNYSKKCNPSRKKDKSAS